jgi:hypothetical protein
LNTPEAKQLANEIIADILERKNINDALYKISRILSYLISEQEERDKLRDLMQILNGTLEGTHDKQGLIHQVNELKEQNESNKKWLRSILTAVIIGLLMKSVELFHLIK